MKQQKKVIGMLLFIVLGYLIYGAFSLYGQKVLGYQYPDGSFLFMPGDRLMDFFNVNQMVYGGRPYVDYYSSYPPFILGIAWLFSRMADYGTYTTMEIRNMVAGKLSYSLFVGIFTILLAVLLYLFFQEHKDLFRNPLIRIVIILGLIFTAPYIFMLDRGNYLIVAIVCYLAFVYYYEKNETLAAVFLGLAAAIKIYPVFLFLLYFVEKKWKNIGIATISAGVVSLLPMLLFKGGFVQNVKEFAYALFSFGGGYPTEVPNVYFGVGLTSLLRFPFVVWNNLKVPDWFPVMPIYLVLGSALALWSLYHLWQEQLLWKKLLIFTTLMVFLSPNAYMYNLVFMLPVILVFLLAKESNNIWIDRMYLAFLGLIMIPKAYYYFLPQHRIGIQVAVDGLLLLGLILFYNVFDKGTRKKREKKRELAHS